VRRWETEEKEGIARVGFVRVYSLTLRLRVRMVRPVKERSIGVKSKERENRIARP